ncbi:hypothetical protein BDZ85DRAFT_123059 [Elsinoe ampelina]|uniref:Early meiotic induction protein 1 n=1 Tax=Elsinoe ampelina TaxID=302913 RepID=A0A6A6GC02_9PEZI|nr:hypothetical protein BDZ85DRAFT_123059 [Elsinoe ampelina]
MGWWPFASSPSSTPSDPSTPTPSSTSPPPPPSTTQPSSLLPPTTPTSRPPNRDEQAEAELTAFLASLDSPPTPDSPSTTTSTSPSPPPPPTPWTRSPSDISPASLRPRTMSCRTLFDSAFYCASLGGKFNDIYRFGSLQPCSEHWDAFWFCMRTKSWGEKEKGEAIARYYEEREGRERERRAGGRSSEDVWEVREEKVEKAFWKVP